MVKEEMNQKARILTAGRLAYADHEKRRLAVLDVAVPGLDGPEVYLHLQAGREIARLPILVLSPKPQEVGIDIVRRMVADTYVTKAMNLSALVAEVGTLVEEEHLDV